MVNEKDMASRYWLLILIPLILGIAGVPVTLYIAIAIASIQIAHFARRTSSLTHISVQVRIVFCTMLLVGLWPPLFFIHWIQVAGIGALLLTDFCLLERMLSLLPWNRTGPLTLSLVRSTFITAPSCWTIPGHAPDEKSPLSSDHSPKIFTGTFPSTHASQDGPESGADIEMKEVTKTVDKLLWLSFSSQTKEEKNND
jgi:hypothetical protein